MKNNIKVVVISTITCFVIFFCIILTLTVPKLIKQKKENNQLSKYYGTYDLISGDITDISQLIDEIKEQKSQIVINKDNIRLTNDMSNLAQNEFFLFVTDEQIVLYAGIHMFADYVDGHSDLDKQICFKLIDNNLKQIYCPNDSILSPFFKTDNINLEYSKKIK